MQPIDREGSMADVRRCEVPERARELAGLGRVDYADCFAVDVAVERSPVEWVRQCAVQMPRLFSAIRVAHRALGLHVAPDDENHLIGWEIVHSQSTEGVLASKGLLGRPRIVGIGSPGQIAVATLIELNGARGRALWAATAPVHRTVAQRILAQISSATS